MDRHRQRLLTSPSAVFFSLFFFFLFFLLLNTLRARLEELRMFLENETWELCPVKSNFNISQLHVSTNCSGTSRYSCCGCFLLLRRHPLLRRGRISISVSDTRQWRVYAVFLCRVVLRMSVFAHQHEREGKETLWNAGKRWWGGVLAASGKWGVRQRRLANINIHV